MCRLDNDSSPHVQAWENPKPDLTLFNALRETFFCFSFVSHTPFDSVRRYPTSRRRTLACLAQSVEHIHGKDEVAGSIPVTGI